MLLNAKSVLFAAAIGTVGIGHASAQVVDWTGPNNGNWNLGSNWSGGLVPSGASAVARIDSFTNGAVVSNSALPPIGSIELVDPSARVNFDAGTLLNIEGTSLINDGLLILNRSGSSLNSVLNFNNTTTLAGTGEIRLSAFTDNAQLAGTGLITNAATHTIRGVGQINVPVVNNGLLGADFAVSVSGGTLDIFADITNNSTLASMATSSTLNINSGVTVAQSPSAQIVAEGGNVVLFGGSSVVGGTLTDTGGVGRIFSSNSGAVTLDSVHHTGTLSTVQPGGTFSIVGSGMVNDGVIQLNPSGSSLNALLSFDQSGLLTGSGEVHMRSFTDNAQVNTATGQSITHAANHTIRGVGQINAAIDNAGVIAADVSVSVSGNILELQTENKTNSGLFIAQPNSVLNIEGITVNQAGGGEIRAEANAVIALFGEATILGGAITSDAAGDANVRSGSVTTLDAVAIDADFIVDPGGTVNIGAGGIINDRTITLNPVGSSLDAVLTADASTAISGSGELQMRTSSNNSRIETTSGAVITSAATHSIRGVGEINGALINNGALAADFAVSVSGSTLVLQNEPKVNNGTMTAAHNSSLILNDVSITQAPSALIEADNAGEVSLGGGTRIENGSISSAGTGRFRTFGSTPSELSGVNSSALLQIEAGTTVVVDSAALVNNGLIEMNRTGSSADGILTLADATISGTGEIRMRTAFDNTQINTATGTSATLGSGQLVRGVGQINGAITNDGEIRADFGVSVSGNSLELRGEDKINNALVNAAPSSFLLINGITLDQTAGGMTLADGGTVAIGSGSSIVGGSLTSAGTGVWGTNTGGFSVEGTTLGGAGFVNAAHTMSVLGGSLANDALIRVNTQFSSADGVIELAQNTSFTGSGTIELVSNNLDSRIAAAPATTPTLTNGSGHTLAGNGTIQTPLVNEGVVRPGRPTGIMNASSGFTQDAAGTFVATISTNGNNGRLAVTGDANLAGTLTIQLAPSAVLTNNFNHVILTATSVDGQFDSAPVLTSGQLVTRVVYEPTQVVLRTRCLADTNLDGTVSPADFNSWIAAFNTQNSVADQNLDGLISPSDFNAWIINFNTPCP